VEEHNGLNMTIQPKRLRLKMELVPQPCWGRNLRNRVKRSQWDRFRRRLIADAGYVRQVCGDRGNLICHEVWHYDDERFVQTLKDLRTLCQMCNFVTHFGKAQLLAMQGKIDLEALVNHFMVVNGVMREVFDAHLRKSVRVFHQRSKHEWRSDYGEWVSRLKEEPRHLRTKAEQEMDN